MADKTKSISGNLSGIIQDSLLLVGVSSIVFGVWQVYVPAAFVVAGTFLFYAGLPKRRLK